MASPFPQVALAVAAAESLAALSAAANRNGFPLAVAPILPHNHAVLSTPLSSLPQTLFISGPENAASTIGVFPTSIDLNASSKQAAANARILVRQLSHWAAHISLNAALFVMPPAQKQVAIAQFARTVVDALSMLPGHFVYIQIPILSSDFDSWAAWNAIRSLSKHHPKLAIALEIGHDLPNEPILNQWLAEPIKMVVLPTTSFLPNKKGFPSLTKKHQSFIQKLMQMTYPRFVISSDSFDSIHPSGTLSSYREYILHLHQTLADPSAIDQFAAGYQDYLQSPLQPLMDNLDSQTYQIFETDPVKYQYYERAVYQALLDRVPDHLASTTTVVVMVLGAGRGPLVDRVIAAAASASRIVQIHVVEKNPNAVIGLRHRLAHDPSWTTHSPPITVTHTDMRFYTPPKKADIIISELLGSFGDNELSPECLDPAINNILSPTGICIPSRYTSYIAPVSSTSLFQQVTGLGETKYMETPYVVKLNAVNVLGNPVPIWSFDHVPHKPRDANGDQDMDAGEESEDGYCETTVQGHPQFNHHNTRYGTASFTMPTNTIIHGFVGYFDAQLYKDIEISIVPQTHTHDMISWFPIYFPIRVPMWCSKDTVVDIHVWRDCDTRKVWYEWSVVPNIPIKNIESSGSEHGTTPCVGEASMIHNVGGRSYWIGL